MNESAGLNPVTSSLSLSSAGLTSPTSKMMSTSSHQGLTVTPLLTTVTQQQSEQQQQTQDNQDGDVNSPGGAANGADATALLNQMNQLGPSDRCTPSQAQAMGQQLLSIIAYHERNKITLPGECVCVCEGGGGGGGGGRERERGWCVGLGKRQVWEKKTRG